jgi:hypothetical protein
MFIVSPASLQTFIVKSNCVLEGRVQCSTVHIPNVFCDGRPQLISCVLYCNRQVHGDFLITLYEEAYIMLIDLMMQVLCDVMLHHRASSSHCF